VSPPPSETVERDLIDGMSGQLDSMGAFEVRRRWDVDCRGVGHSS
jgi:hypothetical protein